MKKLLVVVGSNAQLLLRLLMMDVNLRVMKSWPLPSIGTETVPRWTLHSSVWKCLSVTAPSTETIYVSTFGELLFHLTFYNS